MSERNEGAARVQAAASIIAATVVPIAVVVVANSYTSAVSERQLSARYIELAIDILRDEPREGSRAIRTWAVDVINTYSVVKIPVEVRDQLLDQRILIDSALDGNMKSSAQLKEEVDQLMQKWKRLNEGTKEIPSAVPGDGR